MYTYRHIYSQREGSIFPEKGKDENANHGVWEEGWKYSGYDFHFHFLPVSFSEFFFTINIYYVHVGHFTLLCKLLMSHVIKRTHTLIRHLCHESPRKEKESEAKNVPKEIIAKNSPNLAKYINLEIQDAEWTQTGEIHINSDQTISLPHF